MMLVKDMFKELGWHELDEFINDETLEEHDHKVLHARLKNAVKLARQLTVLSREERFTTYSENQLKPWVTPTITEFDFNKSTDPLD